MLVLIRFYSLGIHPAKVIPIAGTVNATRIQSLIKAVELDLEKKIGLPSGQKAWVKMYLK
jgi:predicted oxidoreductase